MSYAWKETISENGDKYYYNESTNETRWEPPEEGYDPADGGNSVPPAPTTSAPVYSPDSENTHSHHGTTSSPSAPASSPPAQPPRTSASYSDSGNECTCCPGPIQPCCSVCCGTWRKRLKVSVAVLLMGLILEEILLGVLLLLFIDSGAGRFFLDSILEERFGACATIGSGMALSRFYVAAGLIWGLSVAFLSFHKKLRFVSFRGFAPPGTQHALQIKTFFLICMMANGGYAYVVGLPLLLFEAIPAFILFICVLVDSWRPSEKSEKSNV